LPRLDGEKIATEESMSRYQIATALAVMLLLSAACGHKETDRSHDSAAFDAGVMAHAVAKKSEKAIELTGRELGKGAHEAYKGWKEAAREDKFKKKTSGH
jgi:hypothetical protein